MDITHCPICGYPFEGPASEEELRFSFSICGCCGCEYGYDDTPAYRREWLAMGCPWFDGRPPEGWDAQEQLRQAMGLDAAQLSLGKVLEAGSWAAGRRLAGELRQGAPPIAVQSDGTLF